MEDDTATTPTEQATTPSTPVKVAAAEWALSKLPPFVGSRLINRTLRAAGIPIGPATCFWGVPRFSGDPAKHLRIGEYCGFNVNCRFELSAEVTLEDDVSVGHDVVFLGTAPIRIGAGAWLGARAIIHGGVTIGAGAVIGAGTVVRADVPENILLAGQRRVSLKHWR